MQCQLKQVANFDNFITLAGLLFLILVAIIVIIRVSISCDNGIRPHVLVFHHILETVHFGVSTPAVLVGVRCVTEPPAHGHIDTNYLCYFMGCFVVVYEYIKKYIKNYLWLQSFLTTTSAIHVFISPYVS